MELKNLSVILPCYNEEEAIAEVLPPLLAEKDKMLKSKQAKDIEIIVVNDGSLDKSLQELQHFKDQIKIISYSKNQGYGSALKQGFSAAKGEWLVFYDLDKTCQPKDINNLFHSAIHEKADIVLGNRLNKDSKMPWLRQLGNHSYQLLNNFLLKKETRDYCTGFRIFHKKLNPLFCEVLPDDLNFSLAMTILCHRLNIPLIEIPIDYKDRIGQSKLNSTKHGVQFLWTSIHYCLNPKFKLKDLRCYLN